MIMRKKERVGCLLFFSWCENKSIEWQGQEGAVYLETKTFIKGFGMLANSFSTAPCLAHSAGNHI